MLTEHLLPFVFATATLAFSPGPDNIFVLTQSIVNGKKYGLATIAGLMTGCIFHTTLIAFGVSEIMKRNENVFFVVKILGASYLLYLAYSVFKSKADISLSTDGIKRKSLGQLFKTGLWMNLLNPKVTIFFLAFFPQFLFSDSISNVIQFYTLGALFILTSFLVFSSIAILAGAISDQIRGNQKIGEYLKWSQIIVFIGIAAFILF